VHARREGDGASLADDLRRARRRLLQRTAQHGCGAVRVTEAVRGIDVDALVVQCAGRCHGVVAPQHEAREVQAVDAEVEHRATAEGRVIEPVSRIGRCNETKIGFDSRDVPKRLRLEHVAERDIHGEESAPDCFHHESLRVSGSANH